MNFINEDFMLHGETVKRLYHDYAKNLPIIDYHCHISPKMIAENHRFRNVTELMLSGDHYKWRAMRSNGVDEKYITGNAPDYEKFLKFAEMLPLAIGNPLYHWTHLELKRCFGIDECLTPNTCEEIWNRCNAFLETDAFSVHGLIEKFNVEVICTTDDPLDKLEYHQQIKENGFATKVLPAFRPDKAVNIDKETFLSYVAAMGVTSFNEFEAKLLDRIEYFSHKGCCVSDHALDYVPFALGDAKAVFEKKMNGGVISKTEADIFKTYMLRFCANEYSKRDWVMQIHIGAMRNNNSSMYKKLGADIGYDSINDIGVAENLSQLLDSLNSDNILPKTILYSLNPKDNYTLGTMLGNFQSASIPGKLQLGSAWWFNDQRDGMCEQLRTLANTGLLGRFVGMLTDSRSFLSYPRHEYFRRILCNLLAEWVDNGEYPRDETTLKKIVEGISYYNAKGYFDFI